MPQDAAPGPYAFVRNLQTSTGSNLKDFAAIASAESHAKRLDAAARKRQIPGRSHEENYFWSKAGKDPDDPDEFGQKLKEGGADYAAAFRIHKQEHGVKSERKGAALALHLLVGVSPEWLAETGDPRDKDNPRVQALIAAAKGWAESWMGPGAVWAVRYDTDEAGAGVVDLLASPIRQARHKSGSSRPSISVRKANEELAARNGVQHAWRAMQTDWARFAQEHLDPRLRRGTPKLATGREHVPPDDYRKAMEEARRQGRERGHAEGLEQGRAEGRAQGRREAEEDAEAIREAARAQAEEDRRSATQSLQDARRRLEEVTDREKANDAQAAALSASREALEGERRDLDEAWFQGAEDDARQDEEYQAFLAHEARLLATPAGQLDEARRRAEARAIAAENRADRAEADLGRLRRVFDAFKTAVARLLGRDAVQNLLEEAEGAVEPVRARYQLPPGPGLRP